MLSSCSIVKQKWIKPKWIRNIESVYPDLEYLATYSSGTTEQDAKKNALLEIASYFGSTVSSTVQASSTSTQTAVQDDIQTTKQKTITENFDIVSDDVDLFGLEYSDVYFDRKSKKYYICAFINRKKVLAQFVPKLENMRQEFTSFFQDAQKNIEGDPFTALKDFILAENAANKLESGINYLRVIDTEKAREYDIDAKNISTMKKQKADAIRNSTLYLKFPGDVDSILTNAVKSTFLKKGFVFVDKESDAFYILNGNINDNLKIDTDYGTIYTVTPTVNILINKKSDGKTVYSENAIATKKTSNIEKIAAKKRAYQDVANILKEKINNYF